MNPGRIWQSKWKPKSHLKNLFLWNYAICTCTNIDFLKSNKACRLFFAQFSPKLCPINQLIALM